MRVQCGAERDLSAGCMQTAGSQGLGAGCTNFPPLPFNQVPALVGWRCQRRSPAAGCCPGRGTLPLHRCNGGAHQPGSQRQPLSLLAVRLALLRRSHPPPRVLLQCAHLSGCCRPGCGRRSRGSGRGGRGARAALCAPRLPARSGEPARAGHQHGTRHQRGFEARCGGGRHLLSAPHAPHVCWHQRHPSWWAPEVEARPGGGAAGHLRASGGGCGGGVGADGEPQPTWGPD